MPKFIKLDDIWSGEFYLNPRDISFMYRSSIKGSGDKQSSTYIFYCQQNGSNVTNTIEEIMEMINGQ